MSNTNVSGAVYFDGTAFNATGIVSIAGTLRRGGVLGSRRSAGVESLKLASVFGIKIQCRHAHFALLSCPSELVT
jgi:hypothetical protein